MFRSSLNCIAILCIFNLVACSPKFKVTTEKTPQRFVKATCENGLDTCEEENTNEEAVDPTPNAINDVNDAPTDISLSANSISESAAGNAVIGNLSSVDQDSSSFTYTITAGNGAGNFEINGSQLRLVATPNLDFETTASYSLTIRSTDDEGAFFSESITISVTNANDVAPTISNVANQSTNEDTDTSAIAFTISDVDSTLDCTSSVSMTSSNTGVVANGLAVFAGTASSCTVVVTPTADANGSATITLSVSDGSLTATDTFILAVNAVNDAPSISAIADLSTNEDVATSAIAFTIADIDSSIDCGSDVSFSSGNISLVANGSGVIGGGATTSCTITMTPASNQYGTAEMTLTVSDGESPPLSDSESFDLTVTAVNDAPTISNVADQSTTTGVATSALAITVGDIETAAASLTMSGSSSNTTLVPNVNVVFGGSGTNRTVTVTPAAGETGTATITVTVTDGHSTPASTSDAFVLTVGSSYYGVVALSSTTALAVGTSGMIKKTTNSGSSWSSMTLDTATSNGFNGISRPYSTVSFAVGNGGIVYKTVDSGANWSAQTSGTTVDLHAVSFAAYTDYGMAVGIGGKIIATTNLGSTWTDKSPAGVTDNLYGVVVVSSTTAYAVGANGRFLKTTNFGTTWTSSAFSGGETYHAITNVSISQLWIVGTNGSIQHSDDSGSTFTAHSSGAGAATLYSVSCIDYYYCYAAGAGGVLIKSALTGTSWATVSSGTSEDLHGISFSTSGYLVGNGLTTATFSPSTVAQQSISSCTSSETGPSVGPCTNAYDTLNTIWYAYYVATQWVEFDLGASKTITKVEIYYPWDDDSNVIAATIKAGSATNPSTLFKNVSESISGTPVHLQSGWPSSYIYYGPNLAGSRYVRVNFTSYTNSTPRILEIKIYGY